MWIKKKRWMLPIPYLKRFNHKWFVTVSLYWMLANDVTKWRHNKWPLSGEDVLQHIYNAHFDM